MARFITLELGRTVVLIDRFGQRHRYVVRAVKENGWLFEPEGREGERAFHSSESVEKQYLVGAMRYEPWDPDSLSQRAGRRLREDLANQPRVRREKAFRKLRVVRRVLQLCKAGMPKLEALEEGARLIFAQHGDSWHLADVKVAEDAYGKRLALGLVKPTETFKSPRPPRLPCGRTVWEWVTRFAEAGDSINALLDGDADKGRRGSQLSPAQDGVLETYLKDHVRPGGFNESAGLKELNQLLKDNKLSPVVRRTFKRRLHAEFDRKGIATSTDGKRAARRTGAVSKGYLRPDRPMQQVEADHTLLNVKAVHPGTGLELGRPWFSVIKDRCTKMPAGLHLSFLPPQWATTGRACMHAMWPKDLSGHPELTTRWGIHGPMDEMYTDRGLDFICREGREAAAGIGFEMIAFPGYSPWLKGDLERFNRTTKIEILNYRDGVTSFTDKEYSARHLPSMSIFELRDRLLDWIVDDYIPSPQVALMGLSPGEALEAQTLRHGPPRPIGDFDKFSRVGMLHEVRTIQNGGVEFEGVFYKSDRLADIRNRHGAPKRFDIFFEPWNSGFAELRDGNDYIPLRSEYHELDGVSRYRLNYYWEAARRRKPGGARLTVDDFLRAKEEVDADEERILALGMAGSRIAGQNILGRFLDLGEFFTPVPQRRFSFDRQAVEVPGFVYRDGILRPAGRPEPTPMQATPPLVLSNAISAPRAVDAPGDGRARRSPAKVATPAPDKVAGAAPNAMATLVAGARARAAELAARPGKGVQ